MAAIENYIPKEPAQQSKFLKKYPKYDGRGIKIAIIDSDVVDKRLPGMQKTSTGLSKIAECIGKSEITVDTSTIVHSNGSDFIYGLSGQKLKIPSKNSNPSDKWHLGCTFLQNFMEKRHSDCEGNENFKENNIPNMNEKELPQINDENIDCIVWFNGTKWQACINTSSSTNLDDLKILANFDDENEVAYLPNILPYCINVLDDGNSLQILRRLDEHATLVSHVAAAYFPDKPEANGLAPGAQIVSLCMKDIEAKLRKCIELEVDILNLSCGFPVTPSIVKIIKEMVEEHGIIVIFAAGNEGPLYSSISEKSSEILEYCFSIGAIFHQEMREGPRRLRHSVCNFSSKGPLLSSGARGIDFVAPGIAITDLPRWNQNKNQYFEGTSLAAPNAAGSIACLLSALKANKIPYSPSMIKIALANTAFLPEGASKLAYGNGIIQINDAFEYIKKSINNLLSLKSLTPVSINHPKQKGIISIQSKYKLPKEYRYYLNMDSDLDTKWILKSTSNANKFISYSKIDNFFMITIDTNLLEEGSINYAEIYGINLSNPSSGPIFYLPITVICPAESFIDKEIILKPRQIIHFFLKIPSESQKLCVKITSLSGNKKRKIALEYNQKKEGESACWCGRHDNIRGYHDIKFTTIEPTKTILIDIEKNAKLFEICIYHFSSLITSKFKLDIDFHKTNF